jgi:hypothetical protein
MFSAIRRLFSPRISALAAFCATAAMIAVGCHERTGSPPVRPAIPTTAAQSAVSAAEFQTSLRAGSGLLTAEEARAYLGDAVCARCHRKIAADAAHTRHALTLRSVRIAEQGRYFEHSAPVKDSALGYAYRPGVQAGRCVVVGESRSGRRSLPADYVMGAGRNAWTYLSAEHPDAWVDMRLTYYTRLRQWDFTPGQRPGDQILVRAAGIMQAGDQLPACLSCHVTYLRAGKAGPDVAQSHIGIGCERCHGPGRAHLDALERAPASTRPALQMEAYGRALPARINTLCGQCHHDESNSRPGDPKTENGLPRFEGVALVRSRCYQASGTLSCITCHSPHQDAPSTPGVYNAECLKCHSTQTDRPLAAHTAGKACPVNPKSGCVGCHMPAQSIPTIPHATYHNHWIKVWKR